MQDYTGMFEKVASKRGPYEAVMHGLTTFYKTFPGDPKKTDHFTNRALQLQRAMLNKSKQTPLLSRKAIDNSRLFKPKYNRDLVNSTIDGLKANKSLSSSQRSVLFEDHGNMGRNLTLTR